MKYKVQIVDENHRYIKALDADHGQLLHHILVHEQGYHAPCGGKGTCKKCKVQIISDMPHTKEETEFLTEDEIKKGIHFACLLKVTGNITLKLKSDSYQIAQDIYAEEENTEPIVRRTYIDVSKFKDSPKEDHLRTLKEVVGLQKVSLEAMRALPELINGGQPQITVIYDDKEIIAVNQQREESYGIAVDIGTTTIVSYLYNLSTGVYKDVVSDVNYQKNFGFDVISRIKHAHEAEGLSELNRAIVNQLNSMIALLLRKNTIKESQLDELVIVGNTVMLHFLLNTNPKDIGTAPFTPVFTEMICERAVALGLMGAEHCRAVLLPSIAAYVGADITGGILAAKMHEENRCILLIDIGTNGEIVLLNQGKMTCCATAAGPAFEGANITYGVGGVFGAINKVYKEENKLCISTIHDEVPVGICGSGLIDGVAYLLEADYVDETGYLEGDNLTEIDDMAAFELAKKADGTSIYITQKDIREVQLAKGSIRAGIDTMLYENGITAQEVDKVYIAGGFGSYMNQESAIRIGLLPKELEGKIESIGNAAGIGAIKALLNKKYLNAACVAKKKCRYVELSGSIKFMDFYMESMSF